MKIPLKGHIRKNGFMIAWHWDWSITWRWSIQWISGHYKWGVKGFTNDYTGYGFRHLCIGRLGKIEVNWQPNMRRNEDMMRLLDENEKLKEVIRDFASSNAWQNFGDCRRFEGKILKPHELDELACKVLDYEQ